MSTLFLIFQKFAGEMWWCPYSHKTYRGGRDSKEGGGGVDFHSQLAEYLIVSDIYGPIGLTILIAPRCLQATQQRVNTQYPLLLLLIMSR